MSDENLLTRREFTVESALAMLAGVTITITGCGDDDDDPTTNPTPPATDKTGTVSTDAGHTHTGAVITAAQLTAGNAITLTLTGATTHTHTVALISSRAHANQRGDASAKDVVERQRTHAHGDVQLRQLSASRVRQLPTPKTQLPSVLDDSRFGGWELDFGS